MAGVDEKDIQALRDQRTAASALSEIAYERTQQAIAYLQTKGFSYDFSAQQVNLRGADAVLAEKAVAEAPAPVVESHES